jgi:hypothetical protein
MVQLLNNIPDNYQPHTHIVTYREKPRANFITLLQDSHHGGCSRGTHSSAQGKGQTIFYNVNEIHDHFHFFYNFEDFLSK